MDQTLRRAELAQAAPPPRPHPQDFWQSFPPQVVYQLEIADGNPLLLPFQLHGRLALRSLVTLARASTADTPLRWALYVLDADQSPDRDNEAQVAGRARWTLLRNLGQFSVAVAASPERYSLWLPEAVTLEPGVIYGLACTVYTGGAGAVLLVRPDAGDGSFTAVSCQGDAAGPEGVARHLFPINAGYRPPYHVILRSLRGVQGFGIPDLG